MPRTTERRPGPPAHDLGPLARRFGLADIYVFGSRADEIAFGSRTRPVPVSGSDVDIAVRPRGQALRSPDERVELTLALEQALDVPHVDLLILPEASPFLALSAIRGHLLYAADAVDQAEYELFVLRRAGDLAPLERERQDIIMRGGR